MLLSLNEDVLLEIISKMDCYQAYIFSQTSKEIRQVFKKYNKLISKKMFSSIKGLNKPFDSNLFNLILNSLLNTNVRNYDYEIRYTSFFGNNDKELRLYKSKKIKDEKIYFGGNEKSITIATVKGKRNFGNF